MTEQLSDEKQRRINEWWGFRFDSDGTLPFHEMYPNLRPLYMPDGKANYNFWMECVANLRKEVDVMFCHGTWDLQSWKRAWHGPHWAREDPWFALSELLESK